MNVSRAVRALIVVLFAVSQAAPPAPLWADEPAKKIPVTVVADKLDYDGATDVYVAVGHVKIEQEGTRLEADRVVLNNKTGEAEAEGHVYLQDADNVVTAEKLKTNLNTGQGVVYQGELFMKKNNYHLKGDVIERRSETVYHVQQGQFTTCDDDDWAIKADEMNIDMTRYATGSGVTFNMAGVPVLYAPYFLFPVRRQTGFLIPDLGHSSSDGIMAGNAFYWAISDYTDMTIYSDYREHVGHGTGIEYRYENSRESSGQMYYKYWDLYHESRSRWEFRLKHQEEFAEDLSARVDINLVSDDLYYYDLEKKLDDRSQPYLDSNAFYVERWNTASLYLAGQYSIDLTQTNEKTVQKLPELRYTIYDETVAGPVHLNFTGSAANFTGQLLESTRRVDLNPQLSASFGGSGLNFTPRAGVRATFYDRSATTAEPTEREYAYAGADVNARVSRVYGMDAESGIGRIRHSIEPTLSYSFIPHFVEGDLPQFDSVDSVTPQNQVSFALINRVTAHYKESKDAASTSFDPVVLKVSESYDLETSSTTTRPRSDILGELYIKTPSLFTLSANGTYNTYDHSMSSHSVGIGLVTSRVSVNLTEQTTLGTTDSKYLIGGIGLIIGKWDMTGQWWRDIVQRQTTEEEYTLHYAAQCWGVKTTYTHKPGETQFMVMLDLKGIGSNK
jgi:LPS-assembly protein